MSNNLESINTIKHIKDSRRVSDRTFVDIAPNDAERYFTQLTNWIADECRYSLDIIEKLDFIHETGSKILLDGHREQIKKIQDKARELSAGIIGQTAFDDDKLRTDYVSNILKKCLDLLPLVDNLYGIRKSIDELIDVISKSIDSSIEN